MGLWSGISGSFYALGIFSSGFLLAYLSYRNIFFACALLSVIGFFLSLKLSEKKTRRKAQTGFLDNISNLREIPFEVKFMFLLQFIGMTSTYVLTVFGYPLLYKSLGASVSLVGVFIGIAWAVNYGSQIVFGKVADSNDPRRIFIRSLLIIVPINLVLVFVNNLYLVFLLMVIQSGFFGFYNVSIMRMQFDSVGRNNGRDMAFISNAYYLATIAGSFIAGIIMSNFGFSGIFIFRVIGFFSCMIMAAYYLQRG